MQDGKHGDAVVGGAGRGLGRMRGMVRGWRATNVTHLKRERNANAVTHVHAT